MAREEAQRAGKAGISDASFDVADATARERGNAGITAMGQTTPLAPLVVSLQAATGNNDAAPVANSIAMLGMGVRASPRPAPSRSMSMSGGSAKGGSIPPAMAMSGGASGARGPPSIRSRIRDAGLPGGGQHSGPFRYRPPEGYKPGDPLPRGPGGGYLDRFGNEWQKGPYHGDPKKPFTYEWDVQLSQTGRNNFRRHELGEKGYVDIRPDGFLSH